MIHLTINRCIACAMLLMTGIPGRSQTLWDAAKTNKEALTISGWFTAQNVNEFLSVPGGIGNAVNWCKKNGVTKIYLEAFGRGDYADRKTLIAAKDRFLKEGFRVGGGVTTTKFGKDDFANDWKAQCYTNKNTQEGLQRIFPCFCVKN